MSIRETTIDDLYRQAAKVIHETFAGELFWKSKQPHDDHSCSTCNTITSIIKNHINKLNMEEN